ncbi:MAG TPA: acetamidase/formamidase family protein [Actinomycetota bacterium]|nr:acetamidase/formamidase family protein [Actinomycetota bacterium]
MDAVDVFNYTPEPAEFAWTFGGVAPVSSIKPGTVMELWTEDAFGGNVRGPDDLVSKVIDFPFVNPQTGPFYVEGAEPGDTLALHFVSIEPAREWAASTTVSLFGALTSTHTTATLQDPLPERVWIYELDAVGRTVRFNALDNDLSFELPLDPMHGTVGVAPAAFEARSSLVPDMHGGNMDTPEMRANTTCFLGVNVEGALFSIGDGHARQGEGETCGVAVEAAMNTVLVVDLLKGVPCPWPRLENDAYIMTTGSTRPLEDAFRIAHTEMVTWLGDELGIDKLDALQLVTQAAESPVANVCDPNYTFICKIAKKYLGRASFMNQSHEKLKQIGATYRSQRT